MVKFCPELCRLAVATWLALDLSCSSALEFPRPENAYVVAFMDEQFGLQDMYGNNDLGYVNRNAEVRSDINGPFGEINSCWGVAKERYLMCDYHPLPISRTVTLYFFTPATEELGPIFKRDHFFNVNYNKRDLEFKGLKSDGRLEQINVIKDFLIQNAWNFIAFTDDGNNLKMYNEEGSLLETFPSFSKYQTFNEGIYIGSYGDYSDTASMKQTDAIACLYVYDAALTGEEISQIPASCKYKGAPPTTSSTSTTTSTSTSSPPVQTVWPQEEHLIGLWPLSSRYGSCDISGTDLSPSQAQVSDFTVGPHGNADTAVVASKAGAPILKIESTKLAPPDGSFTVSMWFSPQSGSKSGALFEFLDQDGTSRAFQFYYNGSNIEIQANTFLTGRFSMVQPGDRWTFIAVTLENHEKLTVYGDQGMFAQIQNCPTCASSMQFNTAGIALGHSASWSEFIQVGDAVSCLSIYHTALTDSELCQLKDGCRIVNAVALSGQPRLPLSAIPDVTQPMTTTIPSNGQFPWLGSLEYKRNHICSATIVNSLWLLTSASCVLEDQYIYHYEFIAATYDLEVSYVHQQKRGINSISVSGNSPHDLALLELTEPLDMTSDYINDAYIARGGENYANWGKEQLFVGWGINGRSEFDSPTLPRYVAGIVLTDAQCGALWPEYYNSTYHSCFKSLIEDHNVPCHGDEGSPLLVQTDGDVEAGMGERLLQVAVYYRRDADCTRLKPGLFTRTTPFADWIASVVDGV